MRSIQTFRDDTRYSLKVFQEHEATIDGNLSTLERDFKKRRDETTRRIAKLETFREKAEQSDDALLKNYCATRD